MIRKIIYQLGVLIWNNKLPIHYKRLKESEKKSINTLHNEQLEKLKDLLCWAYDNSVFYNELYKKNNFDPFKFSSLDDINNIPIVTKQDLLNEFEKIQVKKGCGKLIFSETSGSTGQSLKFYRNKDWDASTRAAIFRGYSWYDVKPWERNGYFWGFNFKAKFKTKVLDFLQNRFRLFSYDKESIILFSEKLNNASFLEGYSSMIYETAKIINSGEFNFRPKLKLIKGTSEKIFDYYHLETLKAFNKKITSEYGSAETGVIAFECPYGNMHVTMENVIVEEKDNEIIVTNLWSKSFPIIRYKLGDYISMKTNVSCSCGMQHDIITEVTGRVGKLIYGFKDIYPSLVIYYIFKNLAIKYDIILRYQAVQNKKGEIIFRIENSIETSETEKILNEAKTYFNEDMNCIVINNSKPLRLGGKIKDFISELN
jgi:phenylacetate-CoA ligase